MIIIIELKMNLAIRTLNSDPRLIVLFKKADGDDKQRIRFETAKPWIRNGPAYTTNKVDRHRLIVQHVYISDKAIVGHVMHELLHVLGFAHEHQRDDRDEYVTVENELKDKFNYRKCCVCMSELLANRICVDNE
jgi:hypothetical protein